MLNKERIINTLTMEEASKINPSFKETMNRPRWEDVLEENPDLKWRFEFYYNKIIMLKNLFEIHKCFRHDEDVINEINNMPVPINCLFWGVVSNSLFEKLVTGLWNLIFDEKHGKNTIKKFDKKEGANFYGFLGEFKNDLNFSDLRIIKKRLFKNKEPLNHARQKINHGGFDFEGIKTEEEYKKRKSEYNTSYGVSTDFLENIFRALDDFIRWFPLNFGCAYGTVMLDTEGNFKKMIYHVADGIAFHKVIRFYEHGLGEEHRNEFRKKFTGRQKSIDDKLKNLYLYRRPSWLTT